MTRRLPFALAGALAFLFAASARAATVSGRVLDSGGTPVAGAKVAWESYRTDEQIAVDETSGAAPSSIGETSTDAAGRFRVTLDKPGVEVTIRVLPGVLPGALLEGPFDSAEDIALDDVELPAVEKISGRISDESGKPVADARIRVTGGLGFEEEDVVFYADAKSGADGSYSIPNAPAGSVGLSVRSYPVTVPSPTLSIAMTPGGRVDVRTDSTFTGRLLDAVGAPYMIFPGRLDARVTGAPPVVSWGSIAPGSYRLIVSGPSGESVYPFTVTEGATATVQIR